MFPKILTIGAYGYTESAFFQALQAAQVDLLVDIRRRRAVRGARYTFANSERLQTRLAEVGICYQHRLELAPSSVTRQIQAIYDRTTHTAYGQRRSLSATFVESYHRECLDSFDPHAFLGEVGAETKALAFFCVELEPAACHRSLVAARFAANGFDVSHLMP